MSTLLSRLTPYQAGMIDHVINFKEKGYVNHRSDRGGKTMYGVTEAVARAHGYMGAMKDLPLSFAQSIYAKDYLFANGIDRLEPISKKVMVEVFDSGVNVGPRLAVRWLQRSLNVLNLRGKLYPDVSTDGLVGAQETIPALQSLFRQRSEAETVLLRALDCLQGCHYIGLAEKSATQEDFMYGWLRTRIGQEEA